MLLQIVKKLKIAVGAVLLIILVLAFAPRLAAGVLQMGCSQLLSRTEVVDETQAVASVVSRIRQLQRYECARYIGSAFVAQDIPTTFLGIKVGTLRIFCSAPGEVSAGIDVSQFSSEDIDHVDGRLRIALPEPGITSCEIFHDEASIGVYPHSLPIGSASSVAMVQDHLLQEARMELIQQAIACGLLARAEVELRNQATQLARAAGIDCPIVVEFQEGTR